MMNTKQNNKHMKQFNSQLLPLYHKAKYNNMKPKYYTLKYVN